jgi:hypothetical protein
LQAAGEEPGTGSLHLFVEHIDVAGHLLALQGRVVVVGVVNSNQILRHVCSCNSFSGGVLCPSFTTTTNGRTGIRGLDLVYAPDFNARPAIRSRWVHQAEARVHGRIEIGMRLNGSPKAVGEFFDPAPCQFGHTSNLGCANWNTAD